MGIPMLPRLLYKYRDWNDDNHKRLLTHNEIYFTSVMKFNDPFDATIPIRYDLATREQMYGLYKKHITLDNPRLNDEETDKLINKELDKKRYKDPQHIKWFHGYVRQKRETQIGIFSLSEIEDNILMWAHYSDAHKGFCVGFDAGLLRIYFEEDIFSREKLLIEPHKIKYTQEYPILQPFLLCKRTEDIFVDSMTIKSADWSYEKEYRFLLVNGTNKTVRLNEGIITKVIIGCRMPLKKQDEIINTLRRRESRIELLRAELKEGSFGLDFKKVDY
jgi:hypothetical protein